MSYDNKVSTLVSKLSPDVRRQLSEAGLEFAQLVSGKHKLPQGSRECEKVNAWLDARVAEIYQASSTFGICSTLQDIGTHIGSKYSALREAIWLISRGFVQDAYSADASELVSA